MSDDRLESIIKRAAREVVIVAAVWIGVIAAWIAVHHL